MLIDKGMLALRKLACDISGMTKGVTVDPVRGLMAASDGHIMAVVKADPQMPEADYPVYDGLREPQEKPTGEPFQVSAEALEKVYKALPKKAHLPALAYARLDTAATAENRHAVIGVTDLESPQVFRPAKLDARPLTWETYAPFEAPAQEPTFQVSLDVALLSKLTEVLAALPYSTRSSGQKVTLKFYAKDAPIRVEAYQPLSAARFIGCIMPCR